MISSLNIKLRRIILRWKRSEFTKEVSCKYVWDPEGELVPHVQGRNLWNDFTENLCMGIFYVSIPEVKTRSDSSQMNAKSVKIKLSLCLIKQSYHTLTIYQEVEL
jgi:hypothetical protein